MQRIIKVTECKTCKEVLIALVRTNKGDDVIEISAWHTNVDGDLYQFEMLESGDVELLKRIISDFTSVSASSFANSFFI